MCVIEVIHLLEECILEMSPIHSPERDKENWITFAFCMTQLFGSIWLLCNKTMLLNIVVGNHVDDETKFAIRRNTQN